MSKRLYRSVEDKMLAGVCSGIGKYVQVDPLLIRLAFVVVAITEFYLGVIVYGIAAIVMPVKAGGQDRPGEPEVVNHPHPEEVGSSRLVLALVLIGLGAGLMLFKWLPQLRFLSQYLSFIRISLWPLALIVLGILVLVRQRPQ